MNDYQVSVEKMIDEILQFFKDNSGELKASESVLQKHIESLIELDQELADNKKLQQADIKGISVEKKKAKSEISEDIYRLTGSLRSFATDNNNDLLYQEIDESKSGINKKADEDVLNYCNLVIDRLTQYQKELKPYGLTADELVNLTKQRDAFQEILLRPAQMRKNVKVATANIKSIISKALKLLNDSIDNDMLQYKEKKPELYKQYTVLREIDDSQTTHKSIIGTVHDADSDCDGREDECALAHVKVTATFKAGQDIANMHTTTSAKGNYQFTSIPDGLCTLTFTHEQYETVTKEITVYSDKATKVDIKMKKTVK